MVLKLGSTSKDFKVLHVTYSKKVPSGVINQLNNEIEEVKKYGLTWDTILFTTSDIKNDIVININSKYPAPIQWLIVYNWIKRHQEKYNLILLRNIKSDLVGWLIIPFIDNLVTVHHTKEIEECRSAKPLWYGKILSFIEIVFGRLKIKSVNGIAAVTQEIVDYENDRIKKYKPTIVIPNGLNTSEYDISDKRDAEIRQALFISSRFEPWHGLELLLDNLKLYSDPNIVLHLVGQLSQEQKKIIDRDNFNAKIICHGYLDKGEISELFSLADIGFSSFNMEVNALTEASTLKVREYLNNGLPVYSGHRDSGFPNDFKYYRIGEPDFKEIVKFIDEMKTVSKEEVRNASVKYIDKGEILQSTYNKLKRVFG